MSKTVTLGLASIKMGAIAGDGGMGTSLSTLGDTYQDSCTLETDDPNVTDFNVEEYDLPLDSISTPGSIFLNFQIPNPSIDALVSLFGGTKKNIAGEEEDPVFVYEAPASITASEKSIEITPRKGFKMSIVRALVNAKIEGGFGKNQLLLITVRAQILQPTKANIGPFTLAPLTVA